MSGRGLRLHVVALGFAALALLGGVTTASATPTLQLYIEGATYNPSSGDAGFNPSITPDTWYVTSSNFTLWVLGNVERDGQISNVKLAAAYDMLDSPVISITPTTADPAYFNPPFVGNPDPSTPAAVDTANPVETGTGGTPTMGDGSPLPPHDAYTDTTSWEVYQIGHFTLTDSPIGDFTQGGCPGPDCELPFFGQINAYDVSITGDLSHGGWVVFDAFDTIVKGQNKVLARFAPFSHNAETSPTPPVTASEPSTLVLGALGLFGLLGFARRSNRRQSAS